MFSEDMGTFSSMSGVLCSPEVDAAAGSEGSVEEEAAAGSTTRRRCWCWGLGAVPLLALGAEPGAAGTFALILLRAGARLLQLGARESGTAEVAIQQLQNEQFGSPGSQSRGPILG